MAAIIKTEAGTYRLRWRDSFGTQHQKTFETRQKAKKYLEVLTLSPEEKGDRISAADFMAKYRDEVSSKKAGYRTEILRINRLIERDFAKKPLSQVKPEDIERYFAKRMKEPSHKTGQTIGDGTILREADTLSAIFNYAKRLGLIKENPVAIARKPKQPDHRERVASDDDIEKLLLASGWDGESVPTTLMELTIAAFLFSCKTGMRSGEILRMEESWISGRVVRLPFEIIKTRSKREVALSQDAMKILNLVRQREDGGLFASLNDSTRDGLFRKIRDRAGLGPEYDSKGHMIREGLNFHDGRATFCTWAASINPKTGAPRLPIQTLARQTGHKDLKMLMRYYRPKTEQIADYLDAD